jgi:putative membrane protein
MANQTPPSPPPTPDARLSSIRTYLLVAFIFAILFMIVWVLAAIWTIAAFAIATVAGLGIFVILPAFVYLVLFAVSIIVFLRIWKMYNAANAGDIATLKATSNILWAIIALIFAGVIPGIMLIIADGPIKQL